MHNRGRIGKMTAGVGSLTAGTMSKAGGSSGKTNGRTGGKKADALEAATVSQRSA
jgi:hypothetical protein